MPDTLASLQRIFAAALDDPDIDRELAAHLVPARAEGNGDSPDARMGLYRGNVRAARRRALANAYPVLLALGGAAWFDALALAYARAAAPHDADLNRFGATLPAFVERALDAPRYRYFADVARLEWALHRAAFAADAAPFSAHDWQAVGAARLAGARLAVHPACVALASPYALTAIWRAHEAGGRWPDVIDTPSWALVVRAQWRPAVLEHNEAAHAMFVALQLGATLDDALAQALALDAQFDFARQWRVWIETSALVGVLPAR